MNTLNKLQAKAYRILKEHLQYSEYAKITISIRDMPIENKLKPVDANVRRLEKLLNIDLPEDAKTNAFVLSVSKYLANKGGITPKQKEALVSSYGSYKQQHNYGIA